MWICLITIGAIKDSNWSQNDPSSSASVNELKCVKIVGIIKNNTKVSLLLIKDFMGFHKFGPRIRLKFIGNP